MRSMKLKIVTGGLVLLLWLFASGAGAAASNGDFVLVVHPGNEVTRISRVDAERMFLNKKRRWSNGKNISVVIN